MIDEQHIRDAYRGLFNREAESDAVVTAHASHFDNVPDMLRAFVQTPEFRKKHKVVQTTSLFDGLDNGDEPLLARHLVQSAPEPEFVMNFLGVRTRVSHASAFANLDGRCFNDIPTRLHDYHAEAVEFVGVLRAVEAGGGPFVGVELGAGWGSWAVTSGHVARRLGRTPIKLYAVEGNDRKIANIRTHMADNGFDPDAHVQVSAVIGARDGFALFPITEATEGWGSSAIFTEEDADRDGYERVRSISLDTLLKDETLVDLVHFDVQGAEAEAVAAAIDMLTAKVRYLVIGTHGRAIEGRLIDTLQPRGWILENEQPARSRHLRDGVEILQADGTQVWRNPAIPILGTH